MLDISARNLLHASRVFNVRGLYVAEETDTSSSRKKRRLKTSTETIRERSQKHHLEANAVQKPRRGSTFASGFTWPVRKLASLIGKLGRFKFFRIIGYILLPRYVRNSWRELRLVTWPDRRTTLRLTFAVLVFSIIFGLIVAGVDFVLSKIFRELILG